MKDMLYRYLRWGMSIDFPKPRDISLTDYSFEDMKNRLRYQVEKSISKIHNPDDCIFQLSGGFDSSVLVSYFDNVRTFCTGRPGSKDQHFAQKVADHFGHDHTWNGYDKMLDHMDIKKVLLDINRMNPWPRSFKNDFGLYAFCDHIKEHTDYVASGKGVEFQLFGYFTIFNQILENAIALGEYDIHKARGYLKHRKYHCPKDVAPLDWKRMMKFAKTDRKFHLDMVGWWVGSFTEEETTRLLNHSIDEPIFDSMYDITNFVLDWFGQEYVNNRLYDFSQKFGITFHTPYIDSDVMMYTRRIPIEAKKSMEHHKFIFYQAMAHRVPEFVTTRPKGGLNTSTNYFIQNFDKIAELVGVYLRFDSLKVFKYIDFEETQKHLKNLRKNFDNNFRKIWSLLNLSIWMEEHDTDI